MVLAVVTGFLIYQGNQTSTADGEGTVGGHRDQDAPVARRIVDRRPIGR